ncbi:hypothetical protein LMG7141_03993 [Ralstonia condita]|uniref:DUF1254 domain-containing protein n=1 Tax=Ralstonia condita TaxID=3058600 RepID=A0ABM9JR74_9RALS|nr:DUF1254 domain-containing protein [Ralstonia sp. LMG 7141]CAJ0801611.1 hypothetical protein LMG7141_03993 [Ralstonia sp. LMG 7141]
MTHCPAPARLLMRLAVVALSAAALTQTGCSTQPPPATPPAAQMRLPQPAEAQVRSAYVYAFPMMMTDALLQTTSAVAPAGHFMHQRTLDDAALPTGVRARVDVLASSAFIDLRNGPVVLSLPEVGRRHIWVALHDGWTDIFESLGNRTTGARAAHYAITPPGWEGTLPAGVKQVAAPTTLVWIVARTQVAGERDIAAARRVQDRYRITPLEAFGKPAARDNVARARAEANTTTDADADVSLAAARRRVTALDANAYFTRFAALLKDNPPHAADSTMLRTLRDLGITPGTPFDAKAVNPASLKVMDAGVDAARSTLGLAVKQPPITQNGWFIPRMVGAYGLDYAQRAIVAWDGGGTDLPQDLLIATATTDANGFTLDSAHRYVLHFDRSQLPPENAGWAVAAVGTEPQPAPGAARPALRNALSEANHPRLNRDGSLDIMIQRAPPKGMRNNWLPAPAGPFQLRMQLTWPKEAALDGSWLPPAVQRRN